MSWADSHPMTTFVFLATAWALTAGCALILFATVKNADRRARMMLQEARVPARTPRRHAA